MTDDADSLLREIAAAPAIAIPRDLATFVLLEPGTVVDGAFRIEARLGAGGMGVVYAARDLKLDREVALKLMRLDRGLADTLPEVFEREARATARLNHPNVVTLHQFGNWNGLLYLVLERLRGESLNARMDRGGLTLGEGLAIMEQVGRALVHTHAAGITHRDLKPQNVFLVDDSVKVLDFGVSGLGRMPEPPAGALVAQGRSTLSLAGTPGYMAPEQWAGGIQDARTDLFALGVMLYQLVHGALPFGTTAIDARATVPPVPSEVPDLSELIVACLQPAMAARPESAASVVERLAAIRALLDNTSSARRVVASRGHLATARLRSRSRAWRAGLISIVLVAAGAIGVATLVPAARDRCASGGRLAGVWDPVVRARVGVHFGATALRDEITRSLDTYAAQWQPLAESACRDERSAVTTCLDDHFNSFQGVISGLERLAPEGAMGTVHTIPALAECSDPDYLAKVAVPDRPMARDPDALVPWALVIASRGRDMIHAATFIDGDMVIAGFTAPGATIAGTPIPAPPGALDRFGFVARLRRDGSVQWVITGDKMSPLAITRSGREIVVAGTYTPGGSVGKTPLGGAVKQSDGMLFALDGATGATIWTRRIDASSNATVRAVATDAAGNLYAAGDYAGAASFGGSTVYTAGNTTGQAPFVGSWTSTGALRWIDAAHDNADSRTWGVAVDGDTVVFASWVRGVGVFADRAIGTASCVTGKLASATGAVAWLRQDRGSDGRCVIDAVALHGDRIAISGRRYFPPNGGWVAELSAADGSMRWAKALGTSESDTPKALVFGPDGTLQVAGHFAMQTMSVDDTTIVSNGSWDGFVSSFDEHGTLKGAMGLGGVSSDLVRWMTYSPDGHLMIGGRFETTLRVGDRILRGAGTYDGYVVEISPRLLTASRPRAASAFP